MQYSDDKKTEGGNCLLIARGMQFSNTFGNADSIRTVLPNTPVADYYERPGMTSLDKVEEMDQHMVHKWKHQDDSQDLGGLSVDDVPGATKVDPKKAEQEVSKYKAFHEVKAAVAKINAGIIKRRKMKVLELHQNLAEAQKELASTRTRAVHLRARAEEAGKKYIQLAKESTAAHVRSAKFTVQLAEYAKKSKSAQDQVKLAGSKTKEYRQAYSAYRAAGNPLADKMKSKFKQWQDSISVAKETLLRVRQHRLDLKGKAMEAKSQAEKLERDAQWAKSDHKDLVKKSTAQEQLVKMAEIHHGTVKKELEHAESTRS